jgi:Fe-S-cluster containining protein
VTEKEMAGMAEFLKISFEDFVKKYTRNIEGRFSLKEVPSLSNPSDFDCIFLKDKKCTLYNVRPVQCQTFPWWPQNLNSPLEWEETARECEGISLQAPKVSLKVINSELKRYESNF